MGPDFEGSQVGLEEGQDVSGAVWEFPSTMDKAQFPGPMKLITATTLLRRAGRICSFSPRLKTKKESWIWG